MIENKICPHAEKRDKVRAEKRLEAEAARRRELLAIRDKKAKEIRAQALKDLEFQKMNKVLQAYDKNSVFLPTSDMTTADAVMEGITGSF